MSWYLKKGEETKGPYAEEQITQWIQGDQLGSDCLMWQEGMSEWVPVPAATNVAKADVPPQPSHPVPAPGPQPNEQQGFAHGYPSPQDPNVRAAPAPGQQPQQPQQPPQQQEQPQQQFQPQASPPLQPQPEPAPQSFGQSIQGGAQGLADAGSTIGDKFGGAAAAVGAKAGAMGDKLQQADGLADQVAGPTQQSRLVTGADAPMGKRIVAKLIDSLILMLPLGILGFLVGFVIGMLELGAIGLVISMLMNVVLIALIVAYNTIFLKKSGQTIGKKVMGLIVSDKNANCPPTEIALKRSLWELVPFGHLLAFFNDKHASLADRQTGSRVLSI